MRQTGVLQRLILAGAWLLLPAAPAAAEPTLYRIVSAQEQFVVYCADPALGKEAATIAEKIRAGIFSTLGWIGFNVVPAEIRIAEHKPDGENIPPALTTQQGGRIVISTYRQPRLIEEILPREIVNLLLTQMADEERLLRRPQAPRAATPLWLVEGMRARLTGEDSGEPREWRIYQELPLLFEPSGFSAADPNANAQFMRASGAFVHYLLSLPKGNACLKDFVRRFGAGEPAPAAFYAAFKPLFATPAQARLAWRDEVRRRLPPAPVAARELNPGERRTQISAIMDALDVD